MKPFYTFLLAILLLAVSASHAAEKRVALVIGNSAYPSSRLDNPQNDATAMAATFRRLGFEVDLVTDATKADFDAAQKRFAAKADKADAAVLFYAGHGIQSNNFNYLVPIDAKPQSERDLKREMVKLDDIIDDMGNAKVKLVFFDACRDNPLARSFSRGGSRGMVAPNEASGTLISFATKHGNTASDGDGKHSPYTEALLAALENPTEEIHALLRKKVQEAVKKKSGGQQEPWAYGNLNGDFYFIFTGPATVNVQPTAPSATPATRIKTHAEIEQELWDSIKDADSAEAFSEYLKQYPKGKYVAQAKVLLAKLKKDSKTEPVKPATPPVAGGSPEDALWLAVERGNSVDDYDAYLNQYPKGKYAALAKSRKQKLAEQAQREAIQKEQEAWNSAESGNNEEAYNAYLKAYPGGQFAQLAQGRIRKLQADANAKAEQEARQRETEGRQREAEAHARAEQSLWQQAEQSNDKAKVNAYLAQHPAGRYASEARQKLAKIEKEETELRPGKTFKDCTDCPEMVVIPAGSFSMGSEKLNEQPVHTVTFAKPFAMGKTEITHGQFSAFVSATNYNTGNICRTWDGKEYKEHSGRNWRNPGHFQDDNHPVVCVSWDDAKAYVEWLSRKTGKVYLLPSESQWEYACRAGGKHQFCGGDSIDSVAWFMGNSGMTPHPVAQKQANAFGLYDMSGNVWEWVLDDYSGNYKGAPTDGSAWHGDGQYHTARGGSVFDVVTHLGSALSATSRFPASLGSSRAGNGGFRVTRTLP